MNSGGISDISDLRATTLSKKRSRMERDQDAEEVHVVVSEDQIDLNFVVEGDFFDGAEYEPEIETEGQNIAMPDGTEPDEIDQDFDDDNNGYYQAPAGLEQLSPNSRQTVSTFNYANEQKPAFLQGIPSELPEENSPALGSNVVSLSSKKGPNRIQTVVSENVDFNKRTKLGTGE